MDFVAVVDQAIALLRQRGRVAYRTLKRQFQLDDEALEDLKIELIDSQRLATDEQGTVLVWTGAGEVPPAAPAGLSGTVGARPPLDLHPVLSRRENPHLAHGAGRRAQARDRALCRPQRLHGTAGGPRPGGGPPAPRSGAGAHDECRASLRRDREPGHG